jgi:hypothetical protein
LGSFKDRRYSGNTDIETVWNGGAVAGVCLFFNSTDHAWKSMPSICLQEQIFVTGRIALNTRTITGMHGK